MARRAWSRTPAALGVLLASVSCASAYLEAFFPEWHYQQLDLSAAKDEFMATWGADYGYEGLLARIREMDTPHMSDSVYLDWTGGWVARLSP